MLMSCTCIPSLVSVFGEFPVFLTMNYMRKRERERKKGGSGVISLIIKLEVAYNFKS